MNSGSNPTISNSILWKDNAPEGPEIGEYQNSDPDPTVSHCDIQGGYPGIGNIDTDPLFIDSDNGDFHLQNISPCIDSGTNDAPGLTLTDLEGKPRIINGIVDMGAYELRTTNINNNVTSTLIRNIFHSRQTLKVAKQVQWENSASMQSLLTPVKRNSQT